MNRMSKLLAAMIAAAAIAGCGAGEVDAQATEQARAAYESEILNWREGRLGRLKAPTGYLNQVGLYWLKPGQYSFGSDPSNDIVFPASAAPVVGQFDVSESGIRMTVADGVEVTQRGGGPIDVIDMATDITGEPVMADHGSVSWMVIDRAGRFAVRLRDYEHPFVDTFGPIPYYDIDPAMKVEATLERYPEVRITTVGTVIEGLPYNPETPGVVRFNIGGAEYDLEAYLVGDELFFVFGDLTNRDDTYGAGRFLYAPMPGADGKTVLDFNKSYSPPCAFNDFSTCPVASPRNRLNVRIEAGEKFDPALHYAG